MIQVPVSGLYLIMKNKLMNVTPPEPPKIELVKELLDKYKE